MQIDNTTYADLSVFDATDDQSLFNKLDKTKTIGGRTQLMEMFCNPFSDIEKIRQTQEILKIIQDNEDQWGASISNGTIMVIERFYETPLDRLPSAHDPLSARFYQLFHSPDYSLVRYSIGHFADFIRGLLSICEIVENTESPSILKNLVGRIRTLITNPLLHELSQRNKEKHFKANEVVEYGAYIRNHFKQSALALIDIYNKLDAWYSMAIAGKTFNLAEPHFTQDKDPFFEIDGLYHLLLPQAVSYNVQMNRETNFFFLTGANMAGKSTFIKAIGISLMMAHLGMGVPAKRMKLSIFDGILSNINVVDNLVKGESYFFNEVQRIKNTILQINDKKKWLVLIDELFKGTNVEDAMKCSLTVIKGLLKIKTSLFILSTHLYEIGADLKKYPTISFKYFETAIEDGQLKFPYQLREGISNDRLGYLILEREKVVDLLDKL